MKKTEVVLINVWLVLSFLHIATNIFAKELSLHEALQKGLINLNINASGSHSENCIALKVHNTSNTELNLMLEPGVILDNLDEQQQDIIIAKTLKMKLKSNQTLDTSAYGFCCQSSNSSPHKGQKFRLGKKADTLMVKLCKYIDTHKIAPSKAQSAVWTLSNNHKLASLGHPKDTSITALFKICNENRNEALPWFYVGYSQMPGLVYSDIPCKIILNFEYTKKTNKELTIAIYDRAGHKIKTLLANSYGSPGNNSYHFDFDIVNWKNGTYTLKVKEPEQLPLVKTFEI
jgi:hypothetical protein